MKEIKRVPVFFKHSVCTNSHTCLPYDHLLVSPPGSDSFRSELMF